MNTLQFLLYTGLLAFLPSLSCSQTLLEPTNLRVIVNLNCGNSILESGEQCDDGNNGSGDGCSATCEIESQNDNIFYVSSFANGDGSGSDWDNAFQSLPDNLERSYTYYIAQGSYENYTFDDPVFGTQLITVKRATEQDHGTDTGWSSILAEGQAVFGPLLFRTDYYRFDGSHKYGFRVVGGFQGLTMDVDGSYVTIRNADMDGDFAASGGRHSGGSCNVINVNGEYAVIEHNNIHNAADDGIQLHAHNTRIHGNVIHTLHGCGTDGGCGNCYNGHSDGIEIEHSDFTEISNNIIYNIRSTSALMTGAMSGMNDDLVVKNNIFYTPYTGLVVYLHRIGSAKVYNNTIWGRTQGDRYGGLAIGDVSNIDLFNNIILSINFSHMGNSYDPVRHRIDYNLFRIINSNEYIASDHDIAADPLFAAVVESSNIENHITSELEVSDFFLTANSPAINAGLDSPEVPEADLNSKPRDDQPDIGALEH